MAFMRIAVVLSAHENSPTYKDTLESVRKYLSDDVVVLVDGFGWKQFESESVDKIEGFRHGKSSAPVRNMALGMMGAWERWGGSADWYCYMEYDCLVGSGETKTHLGMADERGYWMLGNDMKKIDDKSMPKLNQLERAEVELRYLLGACCFFSREYMRVLAEKDLFRRLLEFTNFFSPEFCIQDSSGKQLPSHDPSEFIYPSLAEHYGGKIEQFASWGDDGSWSGNHQHYPMRYKPDLSLNDPFEQACIMHPLKEHNNPVRECHRGRRN
jgi:hypothetical protein